MNSVNVFNCGGKVNLNEWQLSNSHLLLKELGNILSPRRDQSLSESQIELFDCFVPASTVILNLNHYINCIEMLFKEFVVIEKSSYADYFMTEDSEADFYTLRKNICDFIVYVRTYLNGIKWNIHCLKGISLSIEENLRELFSNIRMFFSRLQSMPDSIFHYSASHLGNKCIQPEFHLLHVHLELRWFFVTLIYSRITCQAHISDGQSEELDETLKLIFKDLIYMSMQIFVRISLSDLKFKTPYSCICVRELWLMLQILIDDVIFRINSKKFWDYLNLILNDILSKNTPEDSFGTWCRNVKKNLPDCRNPELFSIWMIYHTTLLNGYSNDGSYLQFCSYRVKENYEQINRILKVYVNKGGKDGERDAIDEELKLMIPFLRIITIDWWPPRTQTLSLLWECFHRRLNQPFLTQTSGPWSISFEKKTPSDILKQIRERLEDNNEQNREASYGMFLRFLGIFLQRNRNDLKYWNQMKGKIFSKLTKTKVETLSEVGIYNFLSLFLTVAVNVDTENVCSVMLSLLPPTSECLSVDGKKCNLIWKGKLAVALLYNEQNINFSKLSEALIDTVNFISCQRDENSRSMMMSYVETLNMILSSSKQFDRGEEIFLGGWIDRYFSECPKSILGILTQVLVDVFEKCDELSKIEVNPGVKLMLNALWKHVASRVRTSVFNTALIGEHYQNLTNLAVVFTIQALKDRATAKKYKHSAASLFQHFTSIKVKDPRIFLTYLVYTLKNESAIQSLMVEVKNFEIILVQVWIRACILSYNSKSSELRFLTNYIQRLDDVKQIFGTPSEIFMFQESKEPIIIFIMSLAAKRNTMKTEQERIQFDSKYRTYFNNIDKWVLSPLTEENIESELSFWIYRCIGTLIICCSPMMYNRNQQNMLRLLINRVALPTENASLIYVKNVAKRIFSMIILGIENLNVKNDIILQSLIRDLFQEYLPLLITQKNVNSFKASDSILKCFAEAKSEFSRFIFETLADQFIVIPTENTTHKYCFLIIILLKNLLRGKNTYPEYVTEWIISICLPNVIRCYMKVHSLHPHKEQTLDLIQDIILNDHYKQNIMMRKSLQNVILTSVQSCLLSALKTPFEFLKSLKKIDFELVRAILPQIERIISNYEKIGRQNALVLRYSLRQLWEKVEKPSSLTPDQIT